MPVSTCEFFRAKRIFHLSLVSQLEPSGTNWIKTKEKFASREKIRKWKTGFRHRLCALQAGSAYGGIAGIRMYTAR
jgi:hypothetical protein